MKLFITDSNKSFRIQIYNNIILTIKLETIQQLDKEAKNYKKIIRIAVYNNTKEITDLVKIINYPVKSKDVQKEYANNLEIRRSYKIKHKKR